MEGLLIAQCATDTQCRMSLTVHSMGKSNEPVGLDQDGPADRAFEPLDEALLRGSVIDRFDVVARKFSDRLALDDGKRQVSYGTLAANRRSDRFAADEDG